MNILLLGDSHTDIFLGRNSVTRFEMSQCQSSIFTLHRFTNQADVDLWDKLDPWLQHHTRTSSSLIITGGEIDVRAHFWKHIPRSYSNPDDITTYISNIASKFYQTLVAVIKKYQLENIVIWGAPVAGERADYNFEVPFVGSSQTRNILLHLWNKSLLECIKDNPKIALTTAYYSFINPDTYFTVQPNPSHDGVHWHHNFGTTFWEQLILPSLNGDSTLGDTFATIKDDCFKIVETPSTGNQRYDSWVRTDQFSNNAEARMVIINNISYSWSRADQRSLLPNQYSELTIQKI